MTEQEAKRLEAIERVLTDSINRLEAGGASLVDDHTQTLLAAYDEGVKVGESKGGYRAGFAAGQAAASKTIAELQAEVAAIKAAVMVMAELIDAADAFYKAMFEDTTMTDAQRSRVDKAERSADSNIIASAAIEAARKAAEVKP